MIESYRGREEEKKREKSPIGGHNRMLCSWVFFFFSFAGRLGAALDLDLLSFANLLFSSLSSFFPLKLPQRSRPRPPSRATWASTPSTPWSSSWRSRKSSASRSRTQRPTSCRRRQRRFLIWLRTRRRSSSKRLIDGFFSSALALFILFAFSGGVERAALERRKKMV